MRRAAGKAFRSTRPTPQDFEVMRYALEEGCEVCTCLWPLISNVSDDGHARCVRPEKPPASGIGVPGFAPDAFFRS